MNESSLVSTVIPTYNRKEKLIRLIDHILKSDYPKNMLEIIVVDDASIDGTSEEVKRKFPEVKTIRNEKRLLLSGSRNVGIRNASGRYIFLIDDDNVIDKNCISELVQVMEHNSHIGIVAPITYYLKQPNRVLFAGIERSMVTSLTKLIGRNEVDNGQFDKLIESKDFPNAFMIKREVIGKVGIFDEKLFPIHYDEADFGERVRKAGFLIICNPAARVWHDQPLPEESRDKPRLFHVHNELRAYYSGRNRVLFHRKHSKWWQFLIFVLIFNWLSALCYLKVVLFESENHFTRRMKIAKAYLQGVMEGLK